VSTLTPSLASPPEQLVGDSRPRIERAPEAYGTFGPKVVDFAAACGVNLDPWQVHVVNGLFAVDEAGKWVSSEFGLLVSRQNGKGEILVAYDLAHLFMFPRSDNRRKTLMHSAHEVKTAMDGFERLSGVVESKGKLMDRVERNGIRVGNAVGITLEKRPGQLNGDRARFIARTKSSGRGFAGDINVYDEAQEFSSVKHQALTYTQSTISNSQGLYTGTAPGPENDAEIFEGVRDRGRGTTLVADQKTGWMEWSPEGSEDPKAILVHPNVPVIEEPGKSYIDLGSPKAWREGVPSLNIRIDGSKVAEQVSRATDLEALARERFSVWPNRAPVVEEALNELDLAVWAHHADEKARVVAPEAVAVVIGRGGGYATIAFGSRYDPGTFAVTHHKTARGTLWVAKDVAAIKAEFPDALVVLDAKNAQGILTELETEKVKWLAMSLDEIMGAYASFIELVNAGLVEHPPQEEVDKSLKAAIPRGIGRSGFTWDQSDPKTPVTHTQAVTFAVWGVRKLESAPPPPPGVLVGYA
jgi:hypothetical protein